MACLICVLNLKKKTLLINPKNKKNEKKKTTYLRFREEENA